MTDDEKIKSIPELREKGNKQFKEKSYDAAAENYSTAIGLLEHLMLK